MAHHRNCISFLHLAHRQNLLGNELIGQSIWMGDKVTCAHVSCCKNDLIKESSGTNLSAKHLDGRQSTTRVPPAHARPVLLCFHQNAFAPHFAFASLLSRAIAPDSQNSLEMELVRQSIWMGDKVASTCTTCTSCHFTSICMLCSHSLSLAVCRCRPHLEFHFLCRRAKTTAP